MNKTLRILSAEEHVDDGEPNVLQLANDADPLAIEVCLDDVDRIDLDFPKFTDGRAFSQARILRDKLGYRGELRAVGTILRDQYLYMTRCGIDSVELPEDKPIDGYLAALREFSAWYQPASDGRVTVLELRHPARASIRRSGATFISESVAAHSA